MVPKNMAVSLKISDLAMMTPPINRTSLLQANHPFHPEIEKNKSDIALSQPFSNSLLSKAIAKVWLSWALGPKPTCRRPFLSRRSLRGIFTCDPWYFIALRSIVLLEKNGQMLSSSIINQEWVVTSFWGFLRFFTEAATACCSF